MKDTIFEGILTLTPLPENFPSLPEFRWYSSALFPSVAARKRAEIAFVRGSKKISGWGEPWTSTSLSEIGNSLDVRLSPVFSPEAGAHHCSSLVSKQGSAFLL